MGLAGGILIGPSWSGGREDKHTVRRSFCVVWGAAAIDAIVKGTGDNRTARTICRNKPGNSLYVLSRGDTPVTDTIASLRKGDGFLAFGVRDDMLYNGKKGDRWKSRLTAHFICKTESLGLLSALHDLDIEMGDMSLPRFLRALWNNQGVREAALEQDEQMEQPDIWESGED